MKLSRKTYGISFLARKYLAGKSRLPIGKKHLLTLGGIALGVMALITVSSVMNGFRSDIRQRIIGTLSEMRLSNFDQSPLQNTVPLTKKLKANGFNSSPVIRNELLIKSYEFSVVAAVFGIDPTTHPKVSPVLSPKEPESLHGLISGAIIPSAFNEGGIVLGSGLASQLSVFPGDEIQLISPIFSIPSPFGMLPRVHRLKVMAIFAAGMPEYDMNYAFIPLDIAREFSPHKGFADYLEIRSKNPENSRKHLKKLSKILPEYRLEDWSSFDASLYGAIRFEKYLMFVILLFMFIIASFNLTGSMLKIITQKKPELGLLKALGYRDKQLRQVFLLQAIYLSTAGIVLGIVLSGILLYIQAKTGLVKLDQIVLPVKIQLSDYFLVIAVSYLLTWLSILLPLRQLNQIDAVALIRRNA